MAKRRKSQEGYFADASSLEEKVSTLLGVAKREKQRKKRRDAQKELDKIRKKILRVQPTVFLNLAKLGSVRENDHHAMDMLMEEGKKSACCRKYSHDFMHIVTQIMKERNLVNLAVFQNQRQIFNSKNSKITGKAERYFCQHGMNIGMPKNKPAP